MQLVTLDELKQLEIDSAVQEADQALGYDFSFKDVCNEYSQKKTQLKSSLKDNFDKFWRRKAYDQLKHDYLRYKCPPIKLVGVGSSRTAYACLGGKCLKVAMNEAGAAQNKQEQKHTYKKHWWSTTYACFVQTYGSNPDFGLLMSECCAKSNEDNALAISFGMSSQTAFRAVVKAICNDKNHDLMSASTSRKSMAEDLKQKESADIYVNAAEEGSKWLQALQSARRSEMTPGQKSFVQLVKFWKKNGTEELLPGDVTNEDNWGFAIRDGKIAPVMLDVGFSRSIADAFYKM